MATRSAIALETSKGLKAVYCHYDGYPSHHLPILSKKYFTAKKAAELIRPGDISCLETDKNWQRETMPERPLYYHERGETDIEPRLFNNAAELMKWAQDCCLEHVYTYKPRKGWQHSEVDWPPVEPAEMPGCDPAQW